MRWILLLALLIGGILGCEKSDMLTAPDIPQKDYVVGIVNVVEQYGEFYVQSVKTSDGLVYIRLAQAEIVSKFWDGTRQVFIGDLAIGDVPVLYNAYFVRPIDYASLR